MHMACSVPDLRIWSACRVAQALCSDSCGMAILIGRQPAARRALTLGV